MYLYPVISRVESYHISEPEEEAVSHLNLCQAFFAFKSLGLA